MMAISEKVFSKKLEEYLTEVRENAQTVFVTGEHEEDETVVMLKQEQYQDMLRRINNLEYEAKLQRSRKQLEEGKIIMKSMEELEAMENG